MEKDEGFTPDKFKPISEGLGLNHFSDGLPYSNQNDKRKPSVRFHFPPPKKEAVEAKTEPNPTVVHRYEAAPGHQSEGSILRRLFGFIFDIAIITAIFLAIVTFGFAANGNSIFVETFLHNHAVDFFAPLFVFFFSVATAYFVLQETLWRRTFGKALAGISSRIVE